MLREKGQKGFTLIELLLVIAIIGILAAIAIPMFKTQIIKARLTEVTNAMSNVATACRAYHHDTEGSSWPNCPQINEIADSLGVSFGALTRVSAMSVSDTGVITATVSNIDGRVDNSTLALSPFTNADSSITWQWDRSLSTIDPAYVPKR